MKKSKCLQCKKQIPLGAKFCSSKCKDVYIKGKKKCLYCGAYFPIKKSSFCSSTCHQEFWLQYASFETVTSD